MSARSTISVHAWYRFLGAVSAEEALSDLMALVKRLDDAYEVLNYVLGLLASAPDSDVAETLRISRTGVDECIDMLWRVAQRIRDDVPTAG